VDQDIGQNMQHNQYNPYVRAGYTDTPPLPAPLPVQQQVPLFTPNASIPSNEEAKIYQLVASLLDPSEREVALLDLSKKREQHDDLALILWHSFGEWIDRVQDD
jgi:CCR4-NOT transcription complex subunit 9